MTQDISECAATGELISKATVPIQSSELTHLASRRRKQKKLEVATFAVYVIVMSKLSAKTNVHGCA